MYGTVGWAVLCAPTVRHERTNATFYDDERIGDERRIGDVDGGWKVMGVALSFERGVMGGTAVGVPLLRHFREWAALLDAHRRLLLIASRDHGKSTLLSKLYPMVKAMVEPGIEILVEGFQAKDLGLRANGRDVTLPNGQRLFAGSSGTGAPDERLEK